MHSRFTPPAPTSPLEDCVIPLQPTPRQVYSRWIFLVLCIYGLILSAVLKAPLYLTPKPSRQVASVEMAEQTSTIPLSEAPTPDAADRLPGQLSPEEMKTLLRATGEDEAGILLRQIMVDHADLPPSVLGEGQDDAKKVWNMVQQEPERLMALLLQGLPRINPDHFPSEHLWVMNIMAVTQSTPAQKEEFKRLLQDTLIGHAPPNFGTEMSEWESNREDQTGKAHRIFLSLCRDPEEALVATAEILRSQRNSRVQAQLEKQLLEKYPSLVRRRTELRTLSGR